MDGCKGGLPVKRISARAANLIFLFLGLGGAIRAQAEDYYVYQTPNDALVISNQKPPPGSKIIKQLDLPEDPQAQEPGKPQPNGQTDSSPAKNKHTNMTWQEKSR
jgi:hypothetical protein